MSRSMINWPVPLGHSPVIIQALPFILHPSCFTLQTSQRFPKPFVERRHAVSELASGFHARIDPVVLENLDYAGRKSGRTPEEFGAGEFHRARDSPGRKRQV